MFVVIVGGVAFFSGYGTHAIDVRQCQTIVAIDGVVVVVVLVAFWEGRRDTSLRLESA